MKTSLWFCVVSCIALLAWTGPNSLADDFQSLIKDKSLEGWTIKSGYATYELEEDGVVVGRTAEGSGNSFLCTDETFADFELQFEVKVDDGLNSGVQIRSKLKDVEAENSYGGRVFGPQVEIEAAPGYAGFVYGEATDRGWLSEKPKAADAEANRHKHFKNGEWNAYRIVAQGPRLQVWINGEMIEDLTDKPIYETHSEGLIGLQVHGIGAGSGPYEVRWRNLKIKRL